MTDVLQPTPDPTPGQELGVRRPAASPAVLARAAGAALALACLVPGQRPGTAYLAALLGLVVAVGRPGGAGVEGELVRDAGLDRLLSTALPVAAVGLAVVAMLRDAGWLVALCLLAAGACWSVWLSRGSGVLGTALGLLSLPLTSLLAVPFLAAPLRRLGTAEHRSAAAPVMRGAATGGLLLLVFGVLFATADPAFGRLLTPELPALGELFLARVLLGGIALVAVGAGTLLLGLPVGRRDAAPFTGRRRDRLEWVLPLAGLNLLFAGFVAVQVTVLFGGREHVARTLGLSYAEYARQGFAQLVVVAVLALAVVAVALRLAPRESRLLRGLLAVLCLLTVVVLVSAGHRLGLYEQQFGFTRLRLSVDGAIGWLGVVLLLVLVALARPVRAEWLSTAVVLSAAAGLLAFAVADPDARIAAHNVERFAATGQLDAAYLAGLSADAVPALAALAPAQAVCIEVADGPWWNLNLARHRAGPRACPPSLR